MRRRAFLQSSAGLAAAAAEPAPPIPTVRFGKTQITRLIIGSNPFYGYSHANRALDQCMREFYTQDRRMEVLHAAERNGINAWQLHYDTQPIADFKRYRAEGGKMHLILLADFDLMKDPKLLPDAAKLGPLGIAHHGNRTDERFRSGQKELVRDFLKAVRDTGVMVGLSAHNPGVFDTVESEGWDIDYYQCCLYRVSRSPEEMRAQLGEATIGEPFMEKDPERMCKMIRQTKKPCLAFKLLAAGRASGSPAAVERAYRFAYENIKPGDAAIIGMFPKFRDEVKENADLVRRVLGSAG